MLGLLVGFAVFVGPPALAVAAMPRGASARIAGLGPLTLLGAGVFFGASALLSRVMPHGVLLFALAVLASIAFSFAAARALRHEPSAQDPDALRAAALLVAALAALGVLDCLYVYASQSWGIDGRVPHVISPMQLDPQRNTNLSTALLRGSDTVFLPGSRMLYQLFWYHGSAAVLGVLPESVSRYYQVGGFALATGWLLYATVLWAALRLLPRQRASGVVLVFLALLVLLDARLDDTALMGWVSRILHWNGMPGPYYQYFSLKLMALTAPQHALFFVLFLGMAYFRIAHPEARIWRAPLWLPFCVLSLLASPVLAAFVFPAYFVAEGFLWLREGLVGAAKRIGWVLLAVLVADVLHWVLLGFPIEQLFARGGAVDVQVLGIDRVQPPLRTSVLLFVLTSGLTGAVFTVLAALWLLAPRRFGTEDPAKRWVAVFLGTGVVGFVLWNFIVTEVELRRHFSMALALCTTLVVLALLPRLQFGAGRGAAMIVLSLLGLLALALDYRFVRTYAVGAGTTVATDIPWRDYFRGNEFLRRNRAHANVIAASGQGIVLPIPNEAATTLAPKLAILAHQRVNRGLKEFLAIEEDKGAFTVSDISERWLALARRNGYDTVVWGPVEEAEWGYFGREIFLRDATLLADFGEVAVFDLGEGGRMTADAARAVLARIACAAEIRSRLRSAGSPAAFDGERYRLAGPGGASAGDLETLWAQLGKRPCDRAQLLAPPARVIAASDPRGGRNLALGGKARQSSTHEPAADNGALNAIDDQLRGVDRGVTRIAHTNKERGPWWEVDLGVPASIEAVQIWGKHPSFGRRLNNIKILISESRADGDAQVFHVPAPIRDGDIIVTGAKGRFVRIGLAGEGYFVASEVQVWSR